MEYARRALAKETYAWCRDQFVGTDSDGGREFETVGIGLGMTDIEVLRELRDRLVELLQLEDDCLDQATRNHLEDYVEYLGTALGFDRDDEFEDLVHEESRHDPDGAGDRASDRLNDRIGEIDSDLLGGFRNVLNGVEELSR